MDTLEHIALAAGLAWGSGIRVYAVIFIAGGLAYLGVLQLPETLAVLSHPWVLAASGFMFFVEFFVDKIPGVDSIWDALHTFIRIPAGAFLAAAALGQADPVWVAVAAILGGAIASGSHAAKAGGRAVINTSPEPVSNWVASFAEDLIVPAGLLAAVKAPIAFLGVLVVFLGLVIWLLPKLWRALKRIARRISGGPEARDGQTGAPGRN